MKARKILIVVVVLAVLPLLILLHPRAKAAMRLTTGFSLLAKDTRVYCESGAEDFAARFAEALPGAIARVEECYSLPFASEFRVYVCASHLSFTQHIGHPVDSPVRGITFPWDVWVPPKAFSFYGKDTHWQTLAHELSHLHLGQHLGWLRRTKNIPTWFSEGLADWVADTGEERVSRTEAIAAFASGRHLVPDASGKLPLPRQPQDYGLPWPLFHIQSRMFVEYLVNKDQESFKRFVASLLGGARFEVTFKSHFGDSLESVWQEFLDSLKHKDGVKK